MCFSEEVSWATLAASWTGCAVLATRGPEWRAVAAFLAIVGAMQLWEALLWRNQACNPANVTISRLGAVNNHAEPLAYLVACAANLQPASKSLGIAAASTTIAVTALFGILTYTFWKRPRREQCTLDSGNGLVWQWNAYPHGFTKSYWLFLASLLLTTYAYIPPGPNHLVGLAIAATFTASYMRYQTKSMVGSMWCFYAALLPWFFFALSPRS